jgi:hypothetical protein
MLSEYRCVPLVACGPLSIALVFWVAALEGCTIDGTGDPAAPTWALADTSPPPISTGASSMGEPDGSEEDASEEAGPTCVSPTPSFSTDVEPSFLNVFCSSCHGPGEPENSLFDCSSYAGVSTNLSTMPGTLYDFVSTDQMPPSYAAMIPTQAQREVLLNWINCGAPDN